MQGFKVNIKQEKKSKFSSIVLKLRGIDQVQSLEMLTSYGFYFYVINIPFFLIIEKKVGI